MGRSAWDTLAEALGLKTEINWDAVNKRRQMQQNGSMDRRTQQGPMPYFRPPGAQRQTPQGRGMNANPNAMGQIPQGQDVPGGQPNPLYSTPRRSPLSTSPNAPQDMDGGREDEAFDPEEGEDYR